MLFNEDYSYEGIRQVPLVELNKEYITVLRAYREASEAGAEAYVDNNLSLAFAFASEAAVYRVKGNLLEREVIRRDEEDGPMTAGELRDMQELAVGLLREVLG